MSSLMNSNTTMKEERKEKDKGDILMTMNSINDEIKTKSLGEKKDSEIRLGKLNSIVGNLKDNDVDMESIEEEKGGNRGDDVDGGEKLKILGVVGEKRVDSAKILLEENGVIVDSVEEKKRGEKRVVEDCVNDDLSVGNKNNNKKKPRVVDTNEDMKKVAEIVLVLSALGNMRGGRNPTDAEIQFMAEAREKLVGLCEGIAPKDIVTADAVKIVIDDLGINRPKDQRLGFRPPMMSINEKYQLSKRKMEESKKFALQSGIYTSTTVQAGFGSKTESHGAFAHSTQRFPPDRPSHIAVSTGAFQTTTSTVHGNEAQSTSRGQFSNHSERDASSLSVPRTEAQHFRLDGRSNVSAHASQVRANSSGDHLLGKPPATSQLQLGAVARVGPPIKMPDQKVEGAPVIGPSQIAPPDSRDRKSNHPVSQTVYGNLQAVQHPLQGLNFVQASAANTNHNEIAKSVQKFLHPRLPQHPNWTPPSTDYMNKTLTCQICKLSITDVESVLVCDACERGAHIKCLQSFNQKGIPKGEWHCPNCLIQSNGKPLPPKYGRVTRNNPAQNVPPNAAAVQASAVKKAESSDQKVNIQKATANGNPGSLHPSHVGSAVSFRIATSSDPKMLNSREVVAAKSPADNVKMDDGRLSENKALLKNTGSICALSSGKPNESANQKFQSRVSKAEEPFPNSISLPKCEPAVCSDKLSEAGIDGGNSSQDVVRPKSAEASSDPSNKTKVPDSVDASECKPGSDVRKDGQDAAQTVSVGNVGVGNGARDCVKSSLDGLHSVEWVGDILQVVDEKAFYKSCHINGMVYKLQDHALFRSNNGSLRPSKLQALWEDTKTGSKWAIVNSCYFPADLPEVVGRPCSPESNEVYESNHGSTVRAGLVQGTCEVLPPNKFKEESERRIHSENGRQPLFLCKWFYDESKGLFRPVTD